MASRLEKKSNKLHFNIKSVQQLIKQFPRWCHKYQRGTTNLQYLLNIMSDYPQRNIDCQNSEAINQLPEEFKVGDRVTVRSTLAKSRFMGKTIAIELANYPSLIGVKLTIVDTLPPWILCTRSNGDFVPALTIEDLEPLEAICNEVQA